jgi:hypothetical protein
MAYHHETTSIQNRDRILKAVREKKLTYKGKPIKITADFSTETLKSRRAWSEVFQVLNENNFNPRILYPAKLSFKIDRAIKILQDEHKLKQYMTTHHHYRRFYKEFCTQMKANKTTRGQEASNHRRSKHKQSESSTDLTAYNQILTQQGQLHLQKSPHIYRY